MAERARNLDGVPFDEIFETEELYRLGFIQYIDQNIVTDVRFPQEPIPQAPIKHMTMLEKIQEQLRREKFRYEDK